MLTYINEFWSKKKCLCQPLLCGDEIDEKGTRRRGRGREKERESTQGEREDEYHHEACVHIPVMKNLWS